MTESENTCQLSFTHFDRTLLLLQEAIAITEPNAVERAGLVHFFQLAFNLSLEVLICHADGDGFFVKTPRDAVRRALEAGLVSEEEHWMEALQDRKLSTQIYDEQIAVDLADKIRMKYFPLLQQLQQSLR